MSGSTDFVDNELNMIETLIRQRDPDKTMDYWTAFGYKIGGPVCYSYTQWIADKVENAYPDVSDIAFVARDGYLLQQIYQMLGHSREIKTHYVYASRAVKESFISKKSHREKHEYDSLDDFISH